MARRPARARKLGYAHTDIHADKSTDLPVGVSLWIYRHQQCRPEHRGFYRVTVGYRDEKLRERQRTFHVGPVARVCQSEINAVVAQAVQLRDRHMGGR